MDSVRKREWTLAAGRAVSATIDYAPGHAGLPAADVFEIELEGNLKIIIRPSGTEPKIKAYLYAVGQTADEAQSTLNELETEAMSILS